MDLHENFTKEDKFKEVVKIRMSESCTSNLTVRNSKFCHQNFVTANKSSIEELQAVRNNMDVAFKTTVEFFGEDPQAAVPEAFFSVFSSFIHNVDVSRVWLTYILMRLR
jgi:hypothetical protein